MTRSRATLAGTVTFGAAVAAAVLVHAMQKPLDHDEHQFIAGGALLAREGLLPFRDYPYFHLPYLAFLYAPVFAFADKLLASARLLTATAALAVAGIVWARARTALASFASVPDSLRAAVAATFVLALVTNPLFLDAAGRDWNHAVAILLALGAALTIGGIPVSMHPTRAALIAGVLFGLAAGTRATMVLIGPALVLATWLAAREQTLAPARRVATRWLGGATLALLPLVALLALAPDGFVFGNLTYNFSLNPLYRERMGYTVAMSDAQKLDYLFGTVLSHPRTAALTLAYVVSGVALLVSDQRARAKTAPALTIALCLPLLLTAALLPTPSWYQYYYALVPFLLIGILANFSGLESSTARAIAALATAPVLVGALTGARYYAPVMATPPSAWTALVVHDRGVEIAGKAPPGRVLTLGPTYPLEGRLSIYPALATGPFEWRTTPLVTAPERARLNLLGPNELAALSDADAPGALLTGVERDPAENLEAPLLELARQRGWRSAPISGDLTLWAAPSR